MLTRECWERIQAMMPGVTVSVSHTVRGVHEVVHVFRHDTNASIYLVNTQDVRASDGDVLKEAIARVGRGEWKANQQPESEPQAVR